MGLRWNPFGTCSLTREAYSPAHLHLCLAFLLGRILDQVFVECDLTLWIHHNDRRTPGRHFQSVMFRQLCKK